MQISKILKAVALSLIVGAFTTTPLAGFLVGDHRPSVAATALTLLLAVVLMLFAVIAQLVERRRTKATRTWPQAVDRYFDNVQARQDAHALGLPFIENDGSLSWPEVSLPKPSAGQVHRDLHARRMAAEPRMVQTKHGASWVFPKD